MVNKIILYHAGWCPPCKNYTCAGGDWDKVKDKINKLKKQGNEIDFEEYQLENDGDKFKKADIKSFPTLKISRNGKVEDFKGDRTDIDGIIATLSSQNGGGSHNRRSIRQSGGGGGGGSQGIYKAKYLKYKALYLELKRSM
jgi:thiol-disulfide isomerase/thioredoxin